MKKCFEKKRFAGRNLDLITQVNDIISRIKKEKRRPTVKEIHRWLCGWTMMKDTRQDYKRLTKLISNARTAGLIDWDAIDGRRQRNKDEEKNV